MRFYGTYERALDEKKRLIVPAEFRKYLIPEVIVTQNGGVSLAIYREEKIKDFPPETIRKIKIDKQGRMLIPRELIKSTGLRKRVYIYGKGEYLEIRRGGKNERTRKRFNVGKN